MAIFIAKKHRMRILLDGGGPKMVDGVERKRPARWIDFTRTGQVELKDKKDIDFLKHAPGYGRDFVLVPNAPKVVAKEVAKPKENPMKGTPVVDKGRELSATELAAMAEQVPYVQLLNL